MAGSMLLIGTVKSQSPAVAMRELPGPMGWGGGALDASALSVVLGQSVDAEDDDWWDDAAELETSGGNGPGWPAETYTPAAAESDADLCGWCTLNSTGYDAAYDDAMRHAEPETTCYPEALATETNAPAPIAPAAAAATPEWTTAELWCTDHNYCLGLDRECLGLECEPTEAERILNGTRMPVESVESVEETAPRITADQGNDESAPALLSSEASAWLMDSMRGSGAWAGEQLQAWWQAAYNHPWTRQLPSLAATSPSEPDLDHLFAPTVPTALEQPESDTDYQQEVLLITVADSLDRLGVQLQAVAEHLRFTAVERIVIKGNSRRIAKNRN